MAKHMKKGKKGKKGKKKKGKKKRPLPPILKAWKECREEVGAEPFKKMSKTMKRKAKACVDRKMRGKAKRA